MTDGQITHSGTQYGVMIQLHQQLCLRSQWTKTKPLTFNVAVAFQFGPTGPCHVWDHF